MPGSLHEMLRFGIWIRIADSHQNSAMVTGFGDSGQVAHRIKEAPTTLVQSELVLGLSGGL